MRTPGPMLGLLISSHPRMHLGGYQDIELEDEDLEEVEHVEVEDDRYLSHVSSGHKGAGHSHELLVFVDFPAAPPQSRGRCEVRRPSI